VPQVQQAAGCLQRQLRGVGGGGSRGVWVREALPTCLKEGQQGTAVPDPAVLLPSPIATLHPPATQRGPWPQLPGHPSTRPLLLLDRRCCSCFRHHRCRPVHRPLAALRPRCCCCCCCCCCRCCCLSSCQPSCSVLRTSCCFDDGMQGGSVRTASGPHANVHLHALAWSCQQ